MHNIFSVETTTALRKICYSTTKINVKSYYNLQVGFSCLIDFVTVGVAQLTFNRTKPHVEKN